MTQETPIKILIVDDEPSICQILSRWLEEEGYHCVTAAGVDEGWKLLSENGFSLVLLDVMMPEKPGVVLLHQIKEKHPDIAVIMATSMDPDYFEADTLDVGAYAYISKPFDQDTIIMNVAGALQRREEILLAGDSQKGVENESRS